MGKNIHTRIFLPVILVIAFLMAGCSFIFYMATAHYVRYVAERGASRLISVVEELAAETGADEMNLEEKSRQEEREYAKALLSEVRKRIRTTRLNGTLLIFDSKFRFVYPGETQGMQVPEELLDICRGLISRGDLKTGGDTITEVNGEQWHLKLFVLDSSHNIRAKYYTAAVQVPDVSVLWDYTAPLLLLILGGGLLLAVLLVWLIAGSISRPLESFCTQIQRIGEGEDAQIEENYSLKELESLKTSYNRMEDKVRQSEEEKRRFFENVSHDLKTPLASITGYAQGIYCDIMEDPHKAAGIILSESLRMTNLVESILSLTKMDNRELRLEIREIELEEFLDESIEAIQGITKCPIHLETEAKELYIRTDPELLTRIIQNVISNCARYAEQEIAVSLQKHECETEIIVRDDGPGFEESELAHVFERFYKGKKGKYGIGLSVVWSGMQYLGGRVSVENRRAPEHGAVYRLYLPNP